MLVVYERHSVPSTDHFWNGTIIDWCANKQYETSKSSYNAKTRSIHTEVLYKIRSKTSIDQLGTP